MSHFHEVFYPSQAPIECITSLVGIMRGGREQIVAQRKTAGLDFWNIQGFAQRVGIGVPDDVHASGASEVKFGSSTGDDAPTEEEFETKCRECCEAGLAATGQRFGAMDFGKMDWRAAMKWFMTNIAPLIIPLIFEQA
jgi:hypothetical protein